MRVLLIHGETTYFGGAQKMLVYFLSEARAAGLEPVLAMAPNPTLREALPPDLPVVPIPSNQRFSLGGLWRQTQALAAAHRQTPFDVIHGWTARDWELTSAAGRRLRRPTVGLLHDHPLARAISGSRRRLMGLCARWGLDRLICVSQAVHDACAAAGYPAFILRTIRNGIPVPEVSHHDHPSPEPAPGRSADFSPQERPDAPSLRAEARAPKRHRPHQSIADEPGARAMAASPEPAHSGPRVVPTRSHPGTGRGPHPSVAGEPGARAQEARPAAGAPHLGFLGVFTERKGVRLLFKVLDHLGAQRDLDWSLTLAGAAQDPAGETLVADLTRQHQAAPWWPRVRWAGWTPDPFAFLASLDLLIVPSSEFDPFPTVLLEAGAMQTAVFAARVGGVPEIVLEDQTGWTFDPAKPEAAASQLADLLRQPDRLRQAGLRARQRVTTEFALARMIQDYQALYRDLVGVSSPASI